MAVFFITKNGGECEYIKLMKLLYIAERNSLEDNFATISSISFASMEHGPVVSDGLDVMEGKSPNPFWDERIFLWSGTPKVWKLRAGVELNVEDYLSKVEHEVLKKVWVNHGAERQKALRDRTHKFPEWNEQAERESTSFRLELETILIKGLRMEEGRAQAIADDLRFYHSLKRSGAV